MWPNRDRLISSTSYKERVTFICSIWLIFGLTENIGNECRLRLNLFDLKTYKSVRQIETWQWIKYNDWQKWNTKMYYIILTIMFKSGALYLNIACCHLLPNLFKDTPYITTRKRFTVQNCNRQTINYLSFRGLLALNKQLLCFSENRNFTHRKKMTHQAVIMQPTIFYLNNLKC